MTASRVQQPRRKHVPQRTCIACREEKAKRELVRIVRTPEGNVRVDTTGKQSGRGAYLCLEPRCWTKGLVGLALDHALKTQISEMDRSSLQEFAEKFADATIPPSPGTLALSVQTPST